MLSLARLSEVAAQTVTPTASETATPTATRTPSPFPSITPSGALNHFQCYEVERIIFPKPYRTPTLTDQFGAAVGEVRRPIRFCNPANKNDEDPTAPSDPDHLLGYKLKQIDPRPTRIANVLIQNQFGAIVGDLTKPDWLFLPTAKSLTGPPPPLTPVVDHFKCYKLARFAKTRIENVAVEDQFNPPGDLFVDVKKPSRVCLPVDKNGEGIFDADTNLTCYEVRKDPRVPRFLGPDPIFVTNQFNFQFSPLSISITRPTELCVPSLVRLGCCGPMDRCVEADGTVTAGHGIPLFVDVPLGAPITGFPATANGSGLGMFDNDADQAWSFSPTGDDLHVEGPAFCPTAVDNGVHDPGLDCVVLDGDGSLATAPAESCDLETGAACVPPLPAPIKFYDGNLNGAWDDGEDIVLDLNDNGICD